MVQQVLSELTDDGSLAIVRPQARTEAAPQPAPAPIAEQPAAPAPQAEAAPVQQWSPDLSAFESVLAERDAQIAELQRAVVELSDIAPVMRGPDEGAAELIDALNERLSSIETRMFEQDRTIRHTLSMLIEWVEESDSRRDAA
jgi:general secretion pathway protein A